MQHIHLHKHYYELYESVNIRTIPSGTLLLCNILVLTSILSEELSQLMYPNILLEEKA